MVKFTALISDVKKVNYNTTQIDNILIYFLELKSFQIFFFRK